MLIYCAVARVGLSLSLSWLCATTFAGGALSTIDEKTVSREKKKIGERCERIMFFYLHGGNNILSLFFVKRYFPITPRLLDSLYACHVRYGTWYPTMHTRNAGEICEIIHHVRGRHPLATRTPQVLRVIRVAHCVHITVLRDIPRRCLFQCLRHGVAVYSRNNTSLQNRSIRHAQHNNCSITSSIES